MKEEINFILSGFKSHQSGDQKDIKTLVEDNCHNVENKLLSEWLEVDVWISEVALLELGREKRCTVMLDTHRFDVFMDCYNNCSIWFTSGRVRNDILFKLHKLCNLFLRDEDCLYIGRPGSGVFISYFKQNHKNISKKKAMEMCEYDDKYCENHYDEKSNHGFREWLSGTSYGSVCAIEEFDMNWDIKEFQYKDAVVFMKYIKDLKEATQ